MTLLNFEKIENTLDSWKAEFTATEDFNLEIEYSESKVKDCYTKVFLRNAEDQRWKLCDNRNDVTYNMDISRKVYPLYIKVISTTEPVKGSYRYSE